MCIDRMDHIANGRRPLTHTEGYTELLRTTSWLEVWKWLASECPEQFHIPDILQHRGNYSEDAAFAAAAKCHIVDWANYYGYTEKDGEVVIFGED